MSPRGVSLHARWHVPQLINPCSLAFASPVRRHGPASRRTARTDPSWTRTHAVRSALANCCAVCKERPLWCTDMGAPPVGYGSEGSRAHPAPFVNTLNFFHLACRLRGRQARLPGGHGCPRARPHRARRRRPRCNVLRLAQVGHRSARPSQACHTAVNVATLRISSLTTRPPLLAAWAKGAPDLAPDFTADITCVHGKLTSEATRRRGVPKEVPVTRLHLARLVQARSISTQVVARSPSPPPPSAFPFGVQVIDHFKREGYRGNEFPTSNPPCELCSQVRIADVRPARKRLCAIHTTTSGNSWALAPGCCPPLFPAQLRHDRTHIKKQRDAEREGCRHAHSVRRAKAVHPDLTRSVQPWSLLPCPRHLHGSTSPPLPRPYHAAQGRLPQRVEAGDVYAMVASGWLEQWRAYVTSLSETATCPPLDNSSLTCAHENMSASGGGAQRDEGFTWWCIVMSDVRAGDRLVACCGWLHYVFR